MTYADYAPTAAVVLLWVIPPIVSLLAGLRARGPAVRHGAAKDRTALLAPYPGAVELREAIQRADERADTAKAHFRALGWAAAFGAPLLVVLSTAQPVLVATLGASPFGVALARAVLIGGMFLLIYMQSRPTESFCTERARVEFLRLHLHAYLAGVGPYVGELFGPEDARQLERRALQHDIGQLQEKFRVFERACFTQVLPPGYAATIGSERIAAYMSECIEPQTGFFTQSRSREEGMHTGSRRALSIALLTALIAACLACAGVSLHATSRLLGLWTSFLALGAALGVLVLGLRGIFGWDSRAELYRHQANALHEVADAIGEAQRDVRRGGHGVAAAQERFLREAAQFEALMAREECDWIMLSDRQFLEVGI